MPARLWLFLPTYNEVGNLDKVVRATAGALERAVPGDWRILVVDDASPDGTGELADQLAQEFEAVEVLHRTGKDGLGKAYLAGFRYAVERDAEFVIVMDADFSHDPDHLAALIEAAQTSDLVLGSRYVEGGQILDWPQLRRFLSRFGSIYARAILGVRINDLTSGFRCVRRQVLETIEPSTLRAQGYVFNIELTYRALLAGFTVTEVPITFRDREAGQSKMSLPIAFEALMLVPRLRWELSGRRREQLRSAGRRARGRRPFRRLNRRKEDAGGSNGSEPASAGLRQPKDPAR
jgi:dolichol-phosphate mannosyltransferase